jgi:glycosyltransferase involved in cell wall biosynthesis
MAKKYRFHLLGLVHLPCSKEYMSCAFTQKNYKLAKMLLNLGHEVIYYGAEGSTIPCTEFVQTHTLKDIRDAWGEGNNLFEIGYDWLNKDFKHDFNSEPKLTTLKYYAKCIEHINKIKKPNDFLLCTQGRYQSPIVDAVGLYLTCEPGIGYRGSVRGRWRAFESSYIQNFTYGSEFPFKSIDGSFYDRVIPNYFDPDDVEFSPVKDDYFLFIGRMIKRKGIEIANLAAKALNKKLIIAGQGASVTDRGTLLPNDEPDFELSPGNWEYIGFADVEKRKKLMSKAIATFTPTIYLECFAGVHIESMLSGTPPITTNFGVYPGTIPDFLDGNFSSPAYKGMDLIAGYKANTLQDFVDAGKKAMSLSEGQRRGIRKYAERFLMDNVATEFQKWFDDLMNVYESTQDSSKKGWHRVGE